MAGMAVRIGWGHGFAQAQAYTLPHVPAHLRCRQAERMARHPRAKLQGSCGSACRRGRALQARLLGCSDAQNGVARQRRWSQITIAWSYRMCAILPLCYAAHLQVNERVLRIRQSFPRRRSHLLRDGGDARRWRQGGDFGTRCGGEAATCASQMVRAGGKTVERLTA